MTCCCGQSAEIEFEDWKRPMHDHVCECGFRVPDYVLGIARDKSRESVEAKMRQRAVAS